MNEARLVTRGAVLLCGLLIVVFGGCGEPDRDLQSIRGRHAGRGLEPTGSRPRRSPAVQPWQSPEPRAVVTSPRMSESEGTGANGGGYAGSTGSMESGGSGGQSAGSRGANAEGDTGRNQNSQGTPNGEANASHRGGERGQSNAGYGSGNAGNTHGSGAGTSAQKQGEADRASGQSRASAGSGSPSDADRSRPGKTSPSRTSQNVAKTGKAGEQKRPGQQSPSPQQTAPQVGRKAGELTGQEKRPIQSPERTLFPKQSKGRQPDDGTEQVVEDSRKLSTPTTQQAERVFGASTQYEQSGAGDLSVVKVAPAKKQLIRNYFRNLRSVSTSPASAPAFPQSQPNE